MALTPATIMSDIQRHLQDPSAIVWEDADVMEYFNNAMYNILKLRPNAFSVIESKQLVAGTRQTLTAGDYMLLDITKNTGVAGTTEGKIITPIDRRQLDMLLQYWHGGTGKAFTEHYTFEPDKSLTQYYVYPPVKTATQHYIEMNVARPHTKVTRVDQGTVAATILTNALTFAAHTFNAGDRVAFTTTGTLPAGLALLTDYYVLDPLVLGAVTTDFATDDKFDTTFTHGLITDDRVQFVSTGTLPAGLSLLVDYFVINETANTFEVSLTSGGAAVVLTSDGTGTHSVQMALNEFGVSLTSGGSTVVLTDTGTGTHTVNLTNKYTDVALDMAYEVIVKEWMFREAYMKETSVASLEQSARHEGNFYQMLGIRVAAQREAIANRKEGK